MRPLLAHLPALEAEAIHILREGVAEARNPVLLFSGGKDSTVLAYIPLRAFYPAPPPLPLLHIDSTRELQMSWRFATVSQPNIVFDCWFTRMHRGSILSIILNITQR